MKNKYKKSLTTLLILLLLLLLFTFSFAIFNKNFSRVEFYINGFGFNDYSSIYIGLNKNYEITCSSDIDFVNADIKFYPNANFKYEKDGLPFDFIDIYDLDSFDKGEGKNINSAFYIKRSNNSIIFRKDKTLFDLIEFYKGDCYFPLDSSSNVDYYRCEICLENVSINFTFGEDFNFISLSETEVIF